MLAARTMTAIRGFLPCVGLALVSLVGCATPSDHGETPPFDGSLRFSQASGLLKDTTTIDIDPSGTMTLVKPGGDMTTMVLPAASMTELRDKVDQAQLLTLEDAYRCGCHADVVDGIRVQIVDTWHTVIVESSSHYPARLKPLLDMLSGMIETARGRE